MLISRTHAVRLALSGALLLLATGFAAAKIPGVSSPASTKAGAATQAEPKETTAQALARVRKQLDEIREDAERPPEPVPPGISPSEVEELREMRVKLTAANDIQLRALEQIDAAAAARKAAESRARDWTGFETPSPYSIVRIDELRADAAEARDRIRLFESGLAQLRIDTERVQAVLGRADQELRRAEEAASAASTADDKARAAWRRKLAALKARAAAAGTTAVGLMAKYRGDTLATYRAELELLERQIAIASRDVSFTEKDLAAAREVIADKIAAVRRELATLEVQIGQRLSERDAAAKDLASVRARAGSTPTDIAVAEARLAAADALADARRDQTDALRGLIILGEEMSTLWDARYAALRGQDPEARRMAEARLREAARQVAARRPYVENLVREARSSLTAIEARLVSGALPPAALSNEQDTLAARRDAVLTTERLQNGIDTEALHLASWVGELDTAREQRSFGARVGDAWLAVRDAVQNIWNFELFAVEDSTVTDGQTVTFSRGVTVGKSIGAILIFLVGLFAMVTLARRVEKRLVGRGFDAARARTTKRWVLALSAVLLLLLTLNVAKIPVTVFAFLGGALAIGAGFGAQTLIKNLISGMVVLVERQIQVGDIVEVEGITGTITEVNLRSSTVLAFDGTEAIIPNSVFVENRVTNWTHSDRKIRRVIKVGVAYGSPARDVADMLQECAQRHGLVLNDPVPLVIFEDFGDNALVFALHVWLELRPNMSSTQVMSDLRFIIEKRFTEAGISIAYPQRDVHFDTTKPLRVELVQETPKANPPPEPPALP
ncbi:MAG: mechanosensitive ion channel domain-containing protein [Burkholderiaceae bacterium]